MFDGSYSISHGQMRSTRLDSRRDSLCSGDLEMLDSLNNFRQQIVNAESIREDALNANLIDEAVRRGVFEIARWLQDHGSRGCAPSVVDVATAGLLKKYHLAASESKPRLYKIYDGFCCCSGAPGGDSVVAHESKRRLYNDCNGLCSAQRPFEGTSMAAREPQ